MVTASRDEPPSPHRLCISSTTSSSGGGQLAFAESLIAQPAADDGERIELGYLLALSRTPTSTNASRRWNTSTKYTTLAEKLLADTFARSPSKRTRPSPPPPTPVQNAASEEDATAVDQNDLDPRALVTKGAADRPPQPRTAAWASFVQACWAPGSVVSEMRLRACGGGEALSWPLRVRPDHSAPTQPDRFGDPPS